MEPIKKSDIIEVTYRESSPALSRQVLAKLAELYMSKHTAVHREPGTADFFGKQADLYKEAIAQTQEKLQQFGQKQGTVAAHTERDIAVQKANEFEASLRQTNSSIDEARQRISMLEQQIAGTPHRMVTSDRNEDSQLLTGLRQQLTTLQLQRSELLAKYEPTYRPVKDLDVRISQVQQAIADEEKAPLRHFATLPDRVPIARVLLTGGGARLRGLVKELRAQVRIPVEHVSPLDRLDLSRIDLDPEQAASIEPVLATPIGLALPEPNPSVKKFNLVPPEVTQRAFERGVARKTFVAAGVVAHPSLWVGAPGASCRSTTRRTVSAPSRQRGSAQRPDSDLRQGGGDLQASFGWPKGR